MVLTELLPATFSERNTLFSSLPESEWLRSPVSWNPSWIDTMLWGKRVPRANIPGLLRCQIPSWILKKFNSKYSFAKFKRVNWILIYIRWISFGLIESNAVSNGSSAFFLSWRWNKRRWAAHWNAFSICTCTSQAPWKRRTWKRLVFKWLSICFTQRFLPIHCYYYYSKNQYLIKESLFEIMTIIYCEHDI